MLKKTRVKTLMDSQHVKGSEILHKSARQYFSHIFLSLWEKITSKNCVLVVPETLRLFVNILTPDDKYSLSVKASVYCNQFKCHYLKNKKSFQNFFLHFRNLHKIWNTLKKKEEPWFTSWFKEVICFLNCRLHKAGLLKCPKSCVSEHLWRVNMWKGPKHCINLHRSVVGIIFDHFGTKSARKTLF